MCEQADDDVWVYPGGVALHLKAAQKEVLRVTAHRPLIFWGAFEGYHYDAARHRSAGFDGSILSKPAWKASCAVRRTGRCGYELCGTEAGRPRSNRTLHGPFPFAKGPLYFVSSPLIAQLTASEWLTRDLAQTLEPRESDRRATAEMPFEDVYTGMALARIATGGGLAYVHIGTSQSVLYADGWGMRLRPSTVVWHMRTDRPVRIRFAQHWAERRHCDPRPAQIDCRRRAAISSCSNASWLRCVNSEAAYNRSGCSTRAVELKKAAQAWESAAAQVTARAAIHNGHQHERRRQPRMQPRPVDSDRTRET